MTRALWHPLEVVVVDIDDSIPADHRAWLRGRLGVMPRKGGIVFREGASQGAVIDSWQRCADVVGHRHGFALSMAEGLEDTATGRYWLDNAARWKLLYRLVKRHRRVLWPAECDVD